MPRVFVCRNPLLVDLWEPQCIHVGGLPRAICITSRDLRGAHAYKCMLLHGSDDTEPVAGLAATIRLIGLAGATFAVNLQWNWVL